MELATPHDDPDSGAPGSGPIRRADLGLPGPCVAPRSRIEAELVAIWTRILGMDEVGIEDDFFELGGDSQGAALMFADIATRLRTKLPLSLIVEHSTVARLARRVEEAQGSVSAAPEPQPATIDPRWASVLIPLQVTGPQPPLFLVHARHGHVLFARFLVPHLQDELPIYGLQARGLDGKEPAGEDIGAIAADYVGAVRSVCPRGPFQLGGFCGGALIAVEMARQLREAGSPVRPVILIDPPVVPAHVAKGSREDPNTNPRAAAFYYRNTLRKQLGRPESLRDPRFDGHDPVAADNAGRVAVALERAYFRHEPQPYDGPVCFVCSRERVPAIHDPRLPWRRIARGGGRIFIIGEKHQDLFHKQGGAIAKVIRDGLGEGEGAPAGI